MIQFTDQMKKLTNLPEKFFLKGMGICVQKYHDWKKEKESVKRVIPKSHYATEEERMRVVEFKKENMEIGYERLTYLMIDNDVVYLSPSTVYRTLVKAGLNNRWTNPAGEPKKQGFDQPVRVHEQWHTDISYINFKGTFVYFISVLDGYSRAILEWDIRTTMESFDVQSVLWRTCEKWLPADFDPRIISDNGAQFLTKEYKEILKQFSITHTRTSVNHPQSNGKIERFHGTIKNESIRNIPKFTLAQLKEEVSEWIYFYNYQRLHSAIGFVAPMDVINEKKELIEKVRKIKLELAKLKRKNDNCKNHNSPENNV